MELSEQEEFEMICPECKKNNPVGVAVCKSCGAKMTVKAPPSMMTVNLSSKQDIDEQDDYERPPVPHGVVIGLMAAGLLVVAGLIIVVVLLTGQAGTKASAVVPVQVIEQTPEPSPSATAEPTPTPIPTTNPDDDGEDYSSLFEPPQNSVLPEQ